MSKPMGSQLPAPHDDLAQDFEKFTYIVSHDLHTPLRHIKEFTRLLVKSLDGRLDERETGFATHLTRAAESAQGMLDGLLQYSRVATQCAPFAPVDCHAVVEGLIHTQRVQMPSADMAVAIEKPLPIVFGDGVQIRKMFTSLIDNAVKFRASDRPTKIDISASAQDEAWLFQVRDNGIGIPQDLQQATFDVFRRLHPGDEYPGQGMGLALCKKIVERHGGTIGMISELGSGTTVRFVLPSVPE